MYLSLYNISIILIVLVTIKANSSVSQTFTDESDRVVDKKFIDNVIVDLKSKQYPQTSDRYIYKSDLGGNEVTNSHLHSSQMNSTSIEKYFEIINKTSIGLLSWPTSVDYSNRRSICGDIKMCDRKLENDQICLLNLNLILYLSSRQIKLINIGLILNDLTDDFLYFEMKNYEFSVDSSITSEIGIKLF